MRRADISGRLLTYTIGFSLSITYLLYSLLIFIFWSSSLWYWAIVLRILFSLLEKSDYCFSDWLSSTLFSSPRILLLCFDRGSLRFPIKLNFGSLLTKEALLASCSIFNSGVVKKLNAPGSKLLDLIAIGLKRVLLCMVSCDTVLLSLDFESSCTLP